MLFKSFFFFGDMGWVDFWRDWVGLVVVWMEEGRDGGWGFVGVVI